MGDWTAIQQGNPIWDDEDPNNPTNPTWDSPTNPTWDSDEKGEDSANVPHVVDNEVDLTLRLRIASWGPSSTGLTSPSSSSPSSWPSSL